MKGKQNCTTVRLGDLKMSPRSSSYSGA